MANNAIDTAGDVFLGIGIVVAVPVLALLAIIVKFPGMLPKWEFLQTPGFILFMGVLLAATGMIMVGIGAAQGDN